jgi:DNA-binding beta-propeller fold protein YncE
VYQIDTGDPEIPETPLITGSFYGMDVNPDDGNIYVFEASFTGNGTMKIFNDSGTLLSEGTVGIAPSGAVFH